MDTVEKGVPGRGIGCADPEELWVLGEEGRVLAEMVSGEEAEEVGTDPSQHLYWPFPPDLPLTASIGPSRVAALPSPVQTRRWSFSLTHCSKQEVLTSLTFLWYMEKSVRRPLGSVKETMSPQCLFPPQDGLSQALGPASRGNL